MDHAYYVRYGLTGRVGRFVAAAGGIERGQAVVVRTNRGTELGETLLPAPRSSVEALGAEVPSSVRVLRVASAEDLERGEVATRDRGRRFDICRQVFDDGVWPFDLIDVEPLLDDGRTIVHYLGPHDLDVSGLIPVFHAVHGLDVVFEPVGRDAPAHEAEVSATAPAEGCGHCGTAGGCGSGGCGTGDHAAGSGCSDCALSRWAGRRVPAGL